MSTYVGGYLIAASFALSLALSYEIKRRIPENENIELKECISLTLDTATVTGLVCLGLSLFFPMGEYFNWSAIVLFRSTSSFNTLAVISIAFKTWYRAKYESTVRTNGEITFIHSFSSLILLSLGLVYLSLGSGNLLWIGLLYSKSPIESPYYIILVFLGLFLLLFASKKGEPLKMLISLKKVTQSR